LLITKHNLLLFTFQTKDDGTGFGGFGADIDWREVEHLLFFHYISFKRMKPLLFSIQSFIHMRSRNFQQCIDNFLSMSLTRKFSFFASNLILLCPSSHLQRPPSCSWHVAFSAVHGFLRTVAARIPIFVASWSGLPSREIF
jgi:hypothetical protein